MAFNSIIDLSNVCLEDGITYEDTYAGFMSIFEGIAKTDASIHLVCHGAPASWVPLLKYLGVEVVSTRTLFDSCPMVAKLVESPLDRTAIEVLCCFRPETADALWKVDMEWQSKRIINLPNAKSFIVTTSNSYYRREVREYIHLLERYVPTKDKVLLVPCSADKKYPSRIHQKCLDILPKDFYLAVVTGVLGIVPQDLWSVMPYYDAGIPNSWRVLKLVEWYFSKHEHTRVVSYSDFNNEAIEIGLARSRSKRFSFVHPTGWTSSYQDLLSETNLKRLERELNQCAPY